MSSGTREDFTDPPDPEPCSCDEALGLKQRISDLLQAAGVEADVDAGRDPVEAVRSLRHDSNRYLDEICEKAVRIEALETGIREALRLYAGGHEHGDVLRRALSSATPAQAAELIDHQCPISEASSSAQAAEPDDRIASAHGVAEREYRTAMRASDPAQATEPTPVRIHVWCPKCDLKHVDALDEKTGIDWATRPHKTHQCLGCGHQWRPFEYATVGVAERNLDEPEPHYAEQFGITFPGEHPDTIALRECRAELEQTTHNYNDLLQQRNRLENEADSARAERDTALARIAELQSGFDLAVKAAAEKDTRIAELEPWPSRAGKLAADLCTAEDRIKQLEARGQGVSSAEMALHCKIAQAVAALEQYTGSPGAHGNDFRVLEALEALR